MRGKSDGEGGALPRPVLGGKLALVLQDDLLGDGQAEARAARLGGDEELEDVEAGGEAGAGVPDHEPRAAVHEPAFNDDAASLGHRLDGVADEVEGHLLHAPGVEEELGKGRAHALDGQGHARELRFGTHEPDHLLDEAGQGGGLAIGLARSREEQEVADQGVEAFHLLANDAGQGSDLPRQGGFETAGLPLQARELEGDGVQGIAHLVGQAGREGPESGQLLPLHEPRLRVLQLAEGPPLGLAMATGLQSEGNLEGRGLEEQELAVVELLAGPVCRDVQDPSAAALELEGNARVGDGASPPSMRFGMRGHCVVLWATMFRPVAKTSWHRQGWRPSRATCST